MARLALCHLWAGAVILGSALLGCHAQEGGAALRADAPSPPAYSAAPVATATPSATDAALPFAPRTWSFDADAADAPPAGFDFGRTGTGRAGKWLVRPAPDAPSAGNVLAQLDADPTDYRFPVAWVKDVALRDVDVRVRCKPISGSVDEACGLVFRLQDAANYYLTRANALEANVRLYFVKAGRRQQIASHDGKVTKGEWHELRARATGDRLEVDWDGVKVIEQRDATFDAAGSVGVWTKADSVTYFDDLSATAP
jgi:hypothetical protein